jgi:predicted P-loop ATPase
MADTEPTPKRQKPLPPLARAAAQYAAKGYRVFPLEPRGKTPLDLCDGCQARLPARDKETDEKTCRKCGLVHSGPRGLYLATTDAEQVARWWRAIPDANIGIATGNGLLVLDIDGETGAASLASLIDLYGPLPLTPTQKTGKGRHYLFRVETPIKNSASKIAAGIDTRGDGGYIVGGPSIHPSGEPYAWDEDARPSRIDLAPCPQWILDKLAPKISERAAVQQPAPTDADPATLSKYAASALDAEFDRVSSAGKGTRNATLNTAAFSLGQLVGAGLLSEALVLSTLQTAAQNCGYLAEEGPQHVDRIIASGLAAGMAKPRLVELKARPKRAAAAMSQSSTSQGQQETGHGPTEATVHSLADARRAAPAWRESVWLTAEPEDWVLTKDGTKAGGSLHNMLLHLRHERELAGLFALDERSWQIVLTRPAPWGGDPTPFRILADADITGLICMLETRTLRPKAGDAFRAIQFAARENTVNPVRDRLESFQWDGTERLDHWVCDYLGAQDTSFTRQAGAKWLISAVARILRPGCKVDTMLVLEGPQGARKSSALATLAHALGENTFTDRLSKLDNKDSAIELQGNVIVEIAELDAFRNSAVSLIKAFLSRQVDKIRMPHDKTVTDLHRACVFAGTVNPGGAGWMHDVTGGRRFWPIAVTNIDIDGLREIAPQLWAEAAHRFVAGEEWWLTDAIVLAEANRAAMERTEDDVWAPDIDEFIAGKSIVRTVDVLEKLGITDRAKRTGREAKRVGDHLVRRGYVRHQSYRLNGRVVACYVLKEET